jgi:hypothetical protein
MLEKDVDMVELLRDKVMDNESPQIYVEHRDNWTEKLFETIELYHKEQRQRPL